MVCCSALAVPLLAVACGNGTGPSDGGLRLIWSSPRTQAGSDWTNGTPAVDANRVFVQEGNQLIALDASSGARVWSRAVRVAAAPPPTTLRAADGIVYLSETDSIMAVNGATGATIWTVHPDSQAVAEPALDGTTFYTGQRGIPIVYALARADGAVRWKVNVGSGYTFRAHVRGVAVAGDTVYASLERYLDLNGVSASGVLVALAASDGHELWRYETPGTKDYLLDAPLIAGRLVLVNDFYKGDLIAVDMMSHQEVWRTAVGGTERMALVGQTVLTAGVDAKARALDLATGALKWTAETGSSAFGLGTCGASLYVTAFHLRRYDAATGAITGESQVGSMDGGFVTHVASDGTRVFVAGTSGVAAYRC